MISLTTEDTENTEEDYKEVLSPVQPRLVAPTALVLGSIRQIDGPAVAGSGRRRMRVFFRANGATVGGARPSRCGARRPRRVLC